MTFHMLFKGETGRLLDVLEKSWRSNGSPKQDARASRAAFAWLKRESRENQRADVREIVVEVLTETNGQPDGGSLVAFSTIL